MPRANQSLIANRYRIVRLLGEGGFGAVYLAEDNRLGNKRVALKESFDKSQEALVQFRLEAEILANLQHGNLPRVTDSFVELDGCQFLVMDFIEGDDLDEQIIRTKHPLAEGEAVRIMCQVTEAVAYLHTRRPQPIIHRDIKLSNIKLTSSGQAMLVDFGIAKVYHPKKGTAKVAKAVSPHFSPPEQYISQTDTRSDVYALGATLYCLVTAHPPTEAMERLTKGDVLPAPSKYNPAISPALEKIIMKSLELDPDRRFSNANQLLAAMRSYGSAPPNGSANPVPPRPMQRLYCPRCGYHGRPGGRFCPRCGTQYQSNQQIGRPTPVLQPQIDPKLNFEMANLLLKQGEPAQALSRYQACLQNGFTHPAVYQNLAICYVQMKNTPEALAVIDQGMQAHPTNQELLFEKALVYQLVGDIARALSCARTLCNQDNVEGEYWVLYGRLLMQVDQPGEAVKQFKQALFIDSSDIEAQILLGQAYGRQGNLRQCTAELNKAARMDPKRSDPHMWLGLFHLNEKKYSQAIKHFENAIKRDKTLHLAHYFIGKAWLGQDENQKAYQSFKNAVSMYSQDPDYFVGLGLAAALLNKTSEARAEAQRALALDPRHKDALELIKHL